MTRHSKSNRGFMGIAIFAVIAIFGALHLVFPETTLWPFAIASLAVVTMMVSHAGKSHRHPVRPHSESLSNRN